MLQEHIILREAGMVRGRRTPGIRMKITTIHLPMEHIKAINELVANKLYLNMADFVRYAVRTTLENEKLAIEYLNALKKRLTTALCLDCGYEWIPRKPKSFPPKRCWQCGSHRVRLVEHKPEEKETVSED